MKQLGHYIILTVFSLFVTGTLCAQNNAGSGAAATLEKAKDLTEKTTADDAKSTAVEDVEDAESERENIWKTLSRITYRKEYDELMGFKIDKPVFSKQVQDIEGTEITIKGYVIPVEGYKSHTEFIFSAFPYNMCFFCGGAGPETVMEVLASEPVKYSAEQVTLRGKIQLNADDINRLMYQLVDARLVE